MRIIAGMFRGRRLSAPRGYATRPTTDRVREAWFSMLGPIEGTVLDLYAGTGALGFEALSRGASHVTFVESGKEAAQVIKKNADALGVSDRVRLIQKTVETATVTLRQLSPFDLVLTDPPWTHMQSASLALKRLLREELFSKDGRLVLGYPKGKPVSLAADCGLIAEKDRSWGDSAACFYGRKAADTSL